MPPALLLRLGRPCPLFAGFELLSLTRKEERRLAPGTGTSLPNGVECETACAPCRIRAHEAARETLGDQWRWPVEDKMGEAWPKGGAVTGAVPITSAGRFSPRGPLGTISLRYQNAL